MDYGGRSRSDNKTNRFHFKRSRRKIIQGPAVLYAGEVTMGILISEQGENKVWVQKEHSDQRVLELSFSGREGLGRRVSSIEARNGSGENWVRRAGWFVGAHRSTRRRSSTEGGGGTLRGKGEAVR